MTILPLPSLSFYESVGLWILVALMATLLYLGYYAGCFDKLGIKLKRLFG